MATKSFDGDAGHALLGFLDLGWRRLGVGLLARLGGGRVGLLPLLPLGILLLL